MKDKNKEELKDMGEEVTETSEKKMGDESVNAGTEEIEKDPLEAAQERIAELETKLQYHVAEFDNYRKRVLKEKADLILNGGEKVLKDLLPVIDDLERAMANLNKATDIEAIKEGMALIMDKFSSYLKKEGVCPIEAVGQEFNVDYHEAIAKVPGQPEEMRGKVIDCVQTGYTLNDKVIRFSKVAVAE